MTTKKLVIPDDYKDLVYRGMYYLLSYLAPLIPKSVKPNQITIVAFIFGLIGTALLYYVQTPAAYLYWILFNFLWFAFDALDGIHARLTHQTSEYGGFLDHALDNIYFVPMLLVFAIKFDLFYPFYLYVILARLTAAVMVFTVQCHTKRLYLSSLSGGLELPLFSVAMLFSYFYPHFNPALHTTNSFLLRVIDLLHLQSGMFMKLALIPHAIAIPITIFIQFRFVQKELKQ